jgi:serine/threonine protein phosphatase 1
VLPEGLRVYAIGDIHGRFDLLEPLYRQIRRDIAEARAERTVEVFLGDYIDRGPQSREVVEWLIDTPPLADERVCLMGNHEEMVLDAMADPGLMQQWLYNGALSTIASYGVAAPRFGTAAAEARLRAAFLQVFPARHRRFFEGLRRKHQLGTYFFAHAGVRPGCGLDAQHQLDLTWIREPFLGCEDDFGAVVVHGHTPVDRPEVRSNRINIDTGAYFSGLLTCLVLEGADRCFLQASH